jgi:hypothetical protein
VSEKKLSNKDLKILLICGLGIVAGFTITLANPTGWGLVKFVAPMFKDFLLPFVGVIMFVSSFQIALMIIERTFKKRKEQKFIDIDERNKKSTVTSVERDIINNILSEITNSKIKINQTLEDYNTEQEAVPEIPDSFKLYFLDLKNELQRKADIADEKASLLLDRGVRYSKYGIAFYIASMILWQILAWNKGVQSQFIYGIISCSFLFLFVEFLSAWFLKQYRHFVDTSTYLMKIKSIFDKYMLSMLALRELSSDKDITPERVDDMLKFLSADFQWPASNDLENVEVSFAKEALESMSSALKSLSQIKSKTD